MSTSYCFEQLCVASMVKLRCKQQMQTIHSYFKPVGEPGYIWVCVLHGKENIFTGYDCSFWDCLDSEWNVTVVFLEEKQEGKDYTLLYNVQKQSNVCTREQCNLSIFNKLYRTEYHVSFQIKQQI